MFNSVGPCLSWWTLTSTLIILDVTKTFIQYRIVYNYTMMITLNHNSLIAMWWWEVLERQGRTLRVDMKESANKLFQKWKKNQTSQVRLLFWEVCCTCNCDKLGPIYKLAGPHHGLPLWWFIQLTSLTCYYSAAWPMYIGEGSLVMCVSWATGITASWAKQSIARNELSYSPANCLGWLTSGP